MRRGEVVALIGDNGAGMSTLVSFQDPRDETVDISIAQHSGDIGTTAVRIASDYPNTNRVPEPQARTTGCAVITRENIDDPAVARHL